MLIKQTLDGYKEDKMKPEFEGNPHVWQVFFAREGVRSSLEEIAQERQSRLQGDL